MTNTTAEPWHRTESGGMLRNVVYGFNDGLTANFGLIAGMIGAGPTNLIRIEYLGWRRYAFYGIFRFLAAKAKGSI